MTPTKSEQILIRCTPETRDAVTRIQGMLQTLAGITPTKTDVITRAIQESERALRSELAYVAHRRTMAREV